MSTLQPSVAVGVPAIPDDPGAANYLTHGKGILSWLGTLDHKRICIMYLAGILFFFLFAGAAALLFRTALLVPQKWVPGGVEFWFKHDFYNKLFTVHGAVMVFIVIIPGIPAALGNFILPLMLGAKDVAFPRLNLASWYMWAAGCLWLVIALAFGGLDTGWTFYTPYSTTTQHSVLVPALMGVFLLGFSSIFTGLNFIVTIHKLRAPDMGWFQMPLVLWSIYSTAVIQVLATPVLGITLLLLLVERAVGIGIFTPELGGDPVLFQHFFWFYSHPAVYIMILPAMGVMSDLLATFSRKHIFGYTFIAFSSVAIALLSFLVWGHHMFVSGQSALLGTIFSGITFSIAVPSAVKVFNWVATLYQGSIDFKTPMVYALSFIWIFGIGGLTGLFLSTMSTDIHLTDTYFVVAHFHMVMAATIFVFLGGLHYWFPKITGRMYHERLAFWGCIISVIGFNITFLSQFPMGSLGMMRRYYNYPPEFWPYHLASTIGAYIAGLGFFLSVFSLLYGMVKGKRAPANPWGAATLEWRTPSPPPWYNFETTPKIDDPYDYDLIKYNDNTGAYDYVGRPEGVPKPAH